ncbi:hypothetical protein BDZ94DRAFT_1267371 [Collybia nuda]|uniref:Uncharacterized protein n=1 Tax=Collybia nuda TaxID=64659 RepID=A0A9P6CGB4_9AGAR|nr:hypothetical protein BDZ94DRAFT_1267371 [Collybia nuda]
MTPSGAYMLGLSVCRDFILTYVSFNTHVVDGASRCVLTRSFRIFKILPQAREKRAIITSPVAAHNLVMISCCAIVELPLPA